MTLAIRFEACLVFTALLALAGCAATADPPPPPTHPAKGMVVSKTGAPIKGKGQVQFIRVVDHKFTTFGQLDGEGGFSVVTMIGNQTRTPGALEGEYSVQVMLTADEQNPKIHQLSKKQTIKPGENELKIVLE